jgi:LL-diaminopimelate aminotransferase
MTMMMRVCLYALMAMLASSSSGGVTTAFAPLLSTRSSASRRSSTEQDMIARNPNFAKLAGGYLFPEIGRRRNQYVADHPELASKIISLGIGDTTLPIPQHILSGLTSGAAKLGTASGYSGYGDVQGRTDLRAKIAETLYAGTNIEADEVFVSGTLLFGRTLLHAMLRNDVHLRLCFVLFAQNNAISMYHCL